MKENMKIYSATLLLLCAGYLQQPGYRLYGVEENPHNTVAVAGNRNSEPGYIALHSSKGKMSMPAAQKNTQETPFNPGEIVLYDNPDLEDNPDDLVKPGGWITARIIRGNDLGGNVRNWSYDVELFHEPGYTRRIEHTMLQKKVIQNPEEFAAVKRLKIKMEALKKNITGQWADKWIYIVGDEMKFIENSIPVNLCPGIEKYMSEQKQVFQEQIGMSDNKANKHR
jgi:hypothetical protein